MEPACRSERPDSTDWIEEAARRILEDYDARTPGRIFSQPDFEPTPDQAYEIQFAVARLRLRRGETVAGYKIGCVSEAIRRQLGLSRPAFGHVWSGELHADGMELRLEQFAHLAIEGELAVRIASEDGRIDAVFPVIELHNHLFRRTPTSAELIANNAIHAGVVLPAEFATPGAKPERITVFRNGEALGESASSAFPGGPGEAVDLVRQHLRSFGLGLRPGQIVLTGTTLPLYPVRSGDRIRVEYSGGGAVSAGIR